MSNADPRGTVERTYQNSKQETVAVIRWSRGSGPVQAAGPFVAGQSVTKRGGEVVPV